MHIIKKTFLSLPPVWHGTTFWKKYLIKYSTIFATDLITSLVLGTKILYSRTDWHYIAMLSIRSESHCKIVVGLLMEQFYVDGISCPKITQNIVYNGHKRVHSIKFQDLSNGLIGNLSGPYVWRRHDSLCYTSLGCWQIYRDQHGITINPSAFIAYPAYYLSIHLQASFSRQILTPEPVNYNKAISQIRVSGGWLFNEAKLTSQIR